MVSTRLTRCKRVSRIIGSLTPSGGYDHLRKWVKSVTDTPLTVPGEDIKYMVDNSQKIGKTWCLEANSKLPSSVITNHVIIKLASGSKSQYIEELSPRHWFPDLADLEEQQLSKSDENIFRAIRLNFIKKRLEHHNANEPTNVAVETFADVIARSRLVKYCSADDCICENGKGYYVRIFTVLSFLSPACNSSYNETLIIIIYFG